MRLTYDPRHNIAYLRFGEKIDPIETLHVSHKLNVDLAPDGTIYGLELLNANEQLAQADGGCLVVIDEAANEHHEKALIG